MEGIEFEMTNNHDNHTDHGFDVTDPPGNLEITELIAKRRFRIRESASWSTRLVGAFFLFLGIAFLMMPITQGSLLEEFLKEKLGSVSLIFTQSVRVLMIVFVVILSFHLMRRLFGTTEVEGTTHAITRRHKLLGIPLTRAMNQSEFELVELKYWRGHHNDNSDVEARLPGDWEVRIAGTSGLLKLYKTGSLEEAKWLAHFVSEWYGLKVERKGDNRKIGF